MWPLKKSKKASQFFDENSFVTKTLDDKNSIFGIYGKFKKLINDIFNRNRMDDYNIPKIVVIGGDGSGKSSLLEKIIRCPIFPRSTKICTKAPVYLELKNNSKKINKIIFRGKEEIINDKKRYYRRNIRNILRDWK